MNQGHRSSSEAPHQARKSRSGRGETRPRESYPVGVPIQPPPGVAYRAPLPVPTPPPPFPAPSPFEMAPEPFPVFAPLPPPPSRTPAPPRFQADFSLAVKVVLVLGLVIVCMATGWFLFGRRDSQPQPVAKGPVAPAGGELKKDEKKDGEPGASKGDRPPPPEGLPAGERVTFASHVHPIFAARCINCHGSPKKRGGLDVRTIAALRVGGESGPSVKAGPVEETVLWRSIATDRMPPGRTKLTAAERALIRDWIARGAP